MSSFHQGIPGMQPESMDEPSDYGGITQSQGRVYQGMWMLNLQKGKAEELPLSSWIMVRILKLWTQHIFSAEVFRIISGNFNRLFKRNQSLYHKRYKACSTCPKREKIRGIGEICGICGCPLKSKLVTVDEHCDLAKWN